MAKGLTVRQQKFVDNYEGNATEAARQAGYKGTEAALGVSAHRLLRNPKVAFAIRERLAAERNTTIATRQKRQEFWTELMTNPKCDPTVRLRASELLGKSEADFIDRKVHEVGKNLGELLTAPVGGDVIDED